MNIKLSITGVKIDIEIKGSENLLNIIFEGMDCHFCIII